MLAKQAGFSLSAIYDYLAGRKVNYKGLVWSYADGKAHKVTVPRNRGARKHGGSRPVIGTNPDTGTVVRFEYIKQAAETLGLRR